MNQLFIKFINEELLHLIIDEVDTICLVSLPLGSVQESILLGTYQSSWTDENVPSLDEAATVNIPLV